MSTASTTAPAVVRSSSRRQQSYTAPVEDRPRRATSVSAKPSATSGGPSRTHSQAHSQARPPSSSQQQALTGVARRDYETTNVARPPSSSRHSSSRDRSHTTAAPKRTDSTRESRHTASRPSHSRNNSRMSTSEAQSTAGSSTVNPTPSASKILSDISSHGGTAKRRTTITAQTGEWILGKTIGAGSMGKVKLAKNLETGEQVRPKHQRFSKGILFSDRFYRLRSRLYQDNLRKSITTVETGNV